MQEERNHGEATGASRFKLAGEGCRMRCISEAPGHHWVSFTRKHYAKFSPDSASRNLLRVLGGRELRLG